MLGSYTRVFTVHDNTKNGCLGDKEVGVGGGGGVHSYKYPSWPLGNGWTFSCNFKVIITSNLEKQSTLFWYVEMLKG